MVLHVLCFKLKIGNVLIKIKMKIKFLRIQQISKI